MYTNFRGIEGQQFHDNFTSRQFNVSTNHPLIPSSQEYMYYKKYVSIHSEDRDSLKFPNASEFEIEMPQDLLNISSISLVNWSFPSNYNVFSEINSNIKMTFLINNPYNPIENSCSDPLVNAIFDCLFLTQNDMYTITIEEGTYTPKQMVTELTNKFNEVVTTRIRDYFISNGYSDMIVLLNASGGYTNFIIVYNDVSKKIWFGNRADGFILTNSSLIKTCGTADVNCQTRSHLPDFSDWGLPGNLGLIRSDMGSISSSQFKGPSVNDVGTPRFYYGDVTPGDDGYWLLPVSSLPGCQVYWVESIYINNLKGQQYMYMEIEGQNCIDETSPYNLSKFTSRTNETNGIVNSSLAKIPIQTEQETCVNQWINKDALSYKYYLPPAERMRRLKIRLRYHNGMLVDFGISNYSFVLEFTLMSPQILREAKAVVYPPVMSMGR
jgi:hypothetical protein